MPPLHQDPTRPSGSRDAAEPSRPTGRRSRRTGVAAVLAVAALALGACGGGDSSTPTSGSSAPVATDGGNPPMATAVSIGQVAGTVHKPYRQRFHRAADHLGAEVGKAVDAWFDGGFLGVSYPTTSFPDAFTSFTAQAAQDATKQKELMTMGRLGRRIDGVTTMKRVVVLDVLAPRGRAAGVTARVFLRFRTTGDVTRTVTVTGRLFLTQGAGRAWQVFGFDVAKGTT